MTFRKLAYLLLSPFLCFGCGSDSPTDVESEAIPSLIAAEPAGFTTADGFVIGGTYYTSGEGPGRRPGVILVHTRNSDHTLWLPLLPDLTAAGYGVLAYDVRGYGLSRYQRGAYVPISRFEPEQVEQMPLDVGGAVDWLKARPDGDPNRIGVIGADIGANIAYVSSGIFPGVKAAVSISIVGRQGDAFLVGHGVPDFRPRSVLYLASFGDGYAYTFSEALAANTESPTRVVGYQGGANGIFLLNVAAAREELFAWLHENLWNPATPHMQRGPG